jgi:hypothetical protein
VGVFALKPDTIPPKGSLTVPKKRILSVGYNITGGGVEKLPFTRQRSDSTNDPDLLT